MTDSNGAGDLRAQIEAAGNAGNWDLAASLSQHLIDIELGSNGEASIVFTSQSTDAAEEAMCPSAEVERAINSTSIASYDELVERMDKEYGGRAYFITDKGDETANLLWGSASVAEEPPPSEISYSEIFDALAPGPVSEETKRIIDTLISEHGLDPGQVVFARLSGDEKEFAGSLNRLLRSMVADGLIEQRSPLVFYLSGKSGDVAHALRVLLDLDATSAETAVTAGEWMGEMSGGPGDMFTAGNVYTPGKLEPQFTSLTTNG